MKPYLYHLQLNVSDVKISLPFYRELLGYFDYKIIDESKEHLGMGNGTTDFWIIGVENKFRNKIFHRKYPGINHLAFRVDHKEAVDKFVSEFLQSQSIVTLYNSPRHFPEYQEGYYAVYFEDPDRFKLEVLYIP